jgi:N-formylglutamate deformylase
LPDLNFGTADGASCDSALLDRVTALTAGSDCTSVINGRFKGGHITRHHGQPASGVHAIQLELCQCLYMNESAPFEYQPEAAARLQPTLKSMLEAAADAVEAVGR